MDTKPAISTAVFLGSKALGLSVLQCLIKASLSLKWTVIHPADSADARSDYAEFQVFAKANNLEILLANSGSEAKARIASLRPDIGFVCCWYWLIDGQTLDAVHGGLWGIHNSLLPKYRGGAPLVWSIINGDKIVGTTVFRILEGMDDGDVLLHVPVELQPDQGIAEALEAIEKRLVELLPEKWAQLMAGNAVVTVQDQNAATYCGQRAEADGLIEWEKSASDVHNFIRAQSTPYPCAFSYLADEKIKMLKSKVFAGVHFGTPGQVLQRQTGSVMISCGYNTAISITSVGVHEDARASDPFQTLKSVRDRMHSTPSSLQTRSWSPVG